jgi:TolB-like protein
LNADDRPRFLFNGIELDLDNGFLRAPDGTDVPLRPQSLAVLRHLVANAGRVVGKDELMDAVWPGIAVTDNSLTQCISEIRRAIGDAEQRLIRTIPRRGYLFSSATPVPVPRPSTSTLTAADRLAPLDRPSIAVLPFALLSGGSDGDAFVDGLTEDIITDLSRNADLFVIARHSAFAYKNKPLNVQETARNLGVRFVLEGSARRAAGRVRVNAQLIDALTGDHLWADRFERQIEDIFAVQDEVTASIVQALVGRLTSSAPRRRRPASIKAYDLCVRARALTGRSPESGREATILLRSAIALDPDYAEAHRWLAINLWAAWAHWNEPPANQRALALETARKAVALDPVDAGARWTLGHILSYERLWDDSDSEFALALQLDPNDADAWAMTGEQSVFSGRPFVAIDQIMRALRLNPQPPSWYYWELGLAQYAARQYQAAVTTLRMEQTYRTVSRRILAASLAQLGSLAEARQEAGLFMASNTAFTISHWKSVQPCRDEDTLFHFVDGYRMAGLPE